jgi:hypothetical protein
MEVSVLLMQQIAQLFIVLLMGYVVVKAGLLKASDSKVLCIWSCRVLFSTHFKSMIRRRSAQDSCTRWA